MRTRHSANGSRRGFRGVARTIAVVALAGGATLGLGVAGASAASNPSQHSGSPTCIYMVR